MLKEIYKENIHNKNDFTIISFFTENYIKKADRLICSLNNFDLNYKIYKIPNIHFSKSIKGNDDVSYSQPSLILNSIEELNTSVLYVDVDMVFKEKPHKIFFFEKKKIDFAIYNWFEDKDNDAYQPVKATINGKVYKFYKRTHSIDYFNDTNTQLYSSGGVSFHSKSKVSKEILNKWMKNISLYPKSPDDQTLDFTFNNIIDDSKKIKAYWLDKSYCRCRFWIFTKPIIDHPDNISNRQKFTLKNIYNLDRFDETKLGIRRKKKDLAFSIIDVKTKSLYTLKESKLVFLRNFKEEIYIEDN
tara:strand:- start:189 stop:1091 length:903 start_codon:yes stop_codon:yes gene_type:complete